MAAAQVGESAAPKTAAALAFALKVGEQRAQSGDADVASLRAAGFGDEQVVELLAHVALDVPVDFPTIAPKQGKGRRADRSRPAPAQATPVGAAAAVDTTAAGAGRIGRKSPRSSASCSRSRNAPPQ